MTTFAGHKLLVADLAGLGGDLVKKLTKGIVAAGGSVASSSTESGITLVIQQHVDQQKLSSPGGGGHIERRSLLWVFACCEAGELLPFEAFPLYRPFHGHGVQNAGTVTVCISGFKDLKRAVCWALLRCLGVNVAPHFALSSPPSMLLADDVCTTSDKAAAARKFAVPIVTLQWVLDSLLRWELLPPAGYTEPAHVQIIFRDWPAATGAADQGDVVEDSDAEEAEEETGARVDAGPTSSHPSEPCLNAGSPSLGAAARSPDTAPIARAARRACAGFEGTAPELRGGAQTQAMAMVGGLVDDLYAETQANGCVEALPLRMMPRLAQAASKEAVTPQVQPPGVPAAQQEVPQQQQQLQEAAEAEAGPECGSPLRDGSPTPSALENDAKLVGSAVLDDEEEVAQAPPSQPAAAGPALDLQADLDGEPAEGEFFSPTGILETAAFDVLDQCDKEVAEQERGHVGSGLDGAPVQGEQLGAGQMEGAAWAAQPGEAEQEATAAPAQQAVGEKGGRAGGKATKGKQAEGVAGGKGAGAAKEAAAGKKRSASPDSRARSRQQVGPMRAPFSQGPPPPGPLPAEHAGDGAPQKSSIASGPRRLRRQAKKQPPGPVAAAAVAKGVVAAAAVDEPAPLQGRGGKRRLAAKVEEDMAVPEDAALGGRGRRSTAAAPVPADKPSAGAIAEPSAAKKSRRQPAAAPAAAEAEVLPAELAAKKTRQAARPAAKPAPPTALAPAAPAAKTPAPRAKAKQVAAPPAAAKASAAAAAAPAVHVALSGFHTAEQQALIAKLRALHVRYESGSHKWRPGTTHIVTAKLWRNQKCLAAMASGSWLVDKSWADGGGAAGKLAPEEVHEVSTGAGVESGTARHWRLRAASTGGGAFAGLRFAVCTALDSPPSKEDVCAIIKAGGGEVVKLAEPADVILVAADAAASTAAVQRQLQEGAAVATALYVVDWLAKPRAKLDEHLLLRSKRGASLAAAERGRSEEAASAAAAEDSDDERSLSL